MSTFILTEQAFISSLSSRAVSLPFAFKYFAPMVAIQIADFFLLRRSRAEVDFDVRDLVIWALGFIAYRLLMRVDLPVGSSLPDMAFTILLCLAANAAAGKTEKP